MAKCENCVHEKLCYMIEHYGREPEDDYECKRFKDKDEFVQVKHGMWIKDGDKRACSRCGMYIDSNSVDHNYCPDCGAKMEGCKRRWFR